MSDDDMIRRGDAIAAANEAVLKYLSEEYETPPEVYIEEDMRALPAVQVGVKPGEIERAVWSAMIWPADNNLGFSDVPEYTDDGNSFAETECRATAARIRSALTVASGRQDATLGRESCVPAQPSPDVAELAQDVIDGYVDGIAPLEFRRRLGRLQVAITSLKGGAA